MARELLDMISYGLRDRLKTKTVYSLVPKVEPEPWMLLEEKGDVIDVTTPRAWSYLEKVRRGNRWSYLWKPQGKSDYQGGSKLVVNFGPSGAGKDLVSEQIVGRFEGRVTHISCDSYYGPFGAINGSDKPKVFCNNYDHPHSLDAGLLRYHLDLLMSGEKVLVPHYEFMSNSRSVGQESLVNPAPIILVSGIMAAHMLRDKADLVIGVEAPWDVCEMRRIKRDVLERGRTPEHSQAQIESTVRPGYQKFVMPYLNQVFLNNLSESEAKVVWVDNSQEINDLSQAPAVLWADEYLDAVDELLM